MPIRRIPIDFKAVNKSHVNELHTALTKLNFSIAEKAITTKKVDATTIEAIKKIQKENNLIVDGTMNPDTIKIINNELHNRFITTNKYRTEKLQLLLRKLNITIDKTEIEKRIAGESTLKAITEFQKKAGLPEDGKITEEVLEKLHSDVIRDTYTTKTKIGDLHRMLLKAGNIAKLEISIDPGEIKEKRLGASSEHFIKNVQERYKIPVTGILDKLTLDKLTSVVASKGTRVKILNTSSAANIKIIPGTLRLNMISPAVADLQKNLSFLGYKISEKEFKTQSFGKTTTKAILSLQKEKGIAQTGHFDKTTRKLVNKLIVTANPNAVPVNSYRIRGSVRDLLWQRKNNMVIKIFEKFQDSESPNPLAAKKNFLNGFFDILYTPPVNTVNGQVKENFHLVVKLYNNNDQQNPVAVQIHYNVNPIHWVNFTENKNEDGTIDYNGSYAGASDFEITGMILLKAIGFSNIEDIKETVDNKQVSQLSLQTGLSTDDIMCHILSRLVAKSVNVLAILTPEVFYAFIRQNLPADLPGDLLRGTSDWETIGQLTELASSGIVFLDDIIQQNTLENAVSQNLVSQNIKVNKETILQELKKQRNTFALSKPILIGNSNLKSLLDQSAITEPNYATVASVFVNNKGVNASFWEEIKTHEAAIGTEALNDFTVTVEAGNLTKNHIPTVTFLKTKIGNEPGKIFKAASDIAKLEESDLVNLINENGKQVPDNIPGNTPDEKVANYAASVKSRAEFLYPAVSLVAKVKKSNTTIITKITEIQNFIDDHKDLNFRKENIDKYLKDNSIDLDPKVKEEVKVVQRVHKITTNSTAGSVLVGEKLHSSLPIYFMGKDRLTALMLSKGVDAASANRIYEASKMQYMQVLARLTDFRREVNAVMPRSIISHTYSKKEIQETLGDIPNLEILFGSLDYCDCEHCKSLYGPSAYLTDMLRFLKEHDSLVVEAGETLSVKDILFQRRPDLGNIKLNCENTDTALPYIDLVCEILENNIEPQQKDFIYQTTLSQKELRAIPEFIRPHAYSVLAGSDFPMNSSFNLWQEETRTHLNFLRVPRYELMEAFQDISDPNNKVPDDSSVAAEYFGLSFKEKDLITTPRPTAVDQDKYWGFDTTQVSVGVSLFMKRTRLSYYELLELLLVKFVNILPLTKIERPVDSCDTDLQMVINLTLPKLDLMHRFIRLWRKTGWKMWELDLLLRNPKIGNNIIDGDALIHLKQFKQLQEKLRLPLETLLAFYGDINREVRIQPDKPDVPIKPLYNALFQNQAVTNPIDLHFKALDNNNEPIALDGSIFFGVNAGAPHNGYTPVPTILSSLALRQTDFDLLSPKTDNHLSVASLSTLYRYAYLARGLKLNITDLFYFLGIINMDDPFNSLQVTLDSIKNLGYIKASGLTLLELDYILNYKPASSVGLRNETIARLIEYLRSILTTNKEKIDQLKLSAGDRNGILSFDADSIIPMTSAQLIAALVPLKTILNSALVNFTNAAFSVEETNFILEFDTNAVTDARKTELATNIKTLQQNINNLLNQNKNQIISQIATSFNLADEQATILLNKISVLPGPATLLQKLEDESLLVKNPDGSFKEINATNFPDFFNTYQLLHKVSLLVSRMKIDTKHLEWFIDNQAAVNTLKFSELPVTAAVNPNDFNGWLSLYHFLNFKNIFPEPEEVSLRSILDLAKDETSNKVDIIKQIAQLTQWDESNITSLDAGFKLQHTAGNLGYTQAELYPCLMKCFAQMKLTGVDATTMFSWTKITDDTNMNITVSMQARQAIKSKYEQDDWLEKITPLHNDIREKKRFALVEYLLENSQRIELPVIEIGGESIPNPLYWTDSNTLFKYFLIDVEMSACQLTSRIKQALSSIQLFVQRCFLNLENRYVQVTQEEKEDKSSPNAWSQWRWMKNYRIWEANRKIFFYPENWLEPELRDDKSPFFKELESELLQNEVTKENVERAFLNFLHKVDDVSHLEVCGMYHQMEDLNPGEIGFETNIVHVVGRTKSVPFAYYYRTYDMNYSSWSAWEKIDLDIAGDNLVPVVYNRKLHLFWLEFMEKPIKTKRVPAAQVTTGPTEAPEPLKMLELKLAWSVKKTGGWGTKKVSKQKLVHPWERPQYAYNLKPHYQARFNELYLDIYLSTSKEFNNGTFFDPYVKLEKNPVHLTKNRFNQTYLPWHSSSFIFNGEVKDVALKGLRGQYYLPDGTSPSYVDSFRYVHENFGNDGALTKKLTALEIRPRLRIPGGMHFSNNHLTNNKISSPNNSNLAVLEDSATATLLTGAISPFELVITQQDLQLNTMATDHPMFYQDSQRAFFIKPEWEARLDNYGQVIGQNRRYRFMPFYHPYTLLFIRELNRDGINGLLKRNIQISPATFTPVNNFSFNTYKPTASTIVGDEDPTAQKNTDIVDFSFGAANSIYNWELFFHAPLMVACRLMQNQKFEDAMTWFHYIFNPTDIEKYPTPQRYWVAKPFFEYNSNDFRQQRIESILTNINLASNQEQLKAWRNNPFKPHVIARYRPVAYQKNVVMKYLDNLIAWGDMLFKRDTIESINEASLLYILGYEILGERPKKVPNVKHEDFTFNEIEAKLDEFGNARVDVVIEDTLLPITVVPSSSGSEPIPKVDTFYFCIPNNDYLSKYWDTIEDRLFKIRHCMNIEGIVRQLPLFEPPIDPALLVKAATAGIDLSSVLNDVSAPTPYYRFRIVVQKAIDFCNEVKTLGEKLLAALEKKDVEKLTLLRSQNEIQLLEAVKEVRKKQIDEAVETIKSLYKAFDMVEKKKEYFDNLPRMNEWEIGGVISHGVGVSSEIAATVANTLAAGIYLIPQFNAGAAGMGGTPTALVEFGGDQAGKSASKFAAAFHGSSSIAHSIGSMLDNQASYTRRDEENKYQAKLAEIEIKQVQFQINTAEIRQTIAEKDLENHELQIDDSKAVDEFLRYKYTNDQLFVWMISQISSVYFQAYQLAFDMAKKAEKCYQYELGITNSSIIQFGYWDSLKKGLLSGDKLMSDLRRLEAEFINQNKREFEITKNISLSIMAPASLITLKETGKCNVSLPEWLFDMDYPGHYMRRIKNVSLSIPCVVGPYTSVNCTLSLIRNETRMDATLPGGTYEKQDDDTRFKTMFGAISSIATSSAQNDSGMFELNFNDERYLPFEGAGVISDWEINMPIENNYFDFATLSDVIIHVNFTSRNGGGQLAVAANASLQNTLPSQAARLFSLKHEFATEWYRFLNPQGANDQELIIKLRPEHFPFFIRGKLNALKMKKLDMFVESSDPSNFDFTANIKITSSDFVNDLPVSRDVSFNNLHHLSRDLTTAAPVVPGEVRLKIKLSTDVDFKSLPADKIDNMFLLFQLGI